jgi:hypothetical protein
MARVRVILVISIVGLSVVLAWTAPELAKFAWLLFLVVPPTAERITRVLERRRRLPPVENEEPSKIARG